MPPESDKTTLEETLLREVAKTQGEILEYIRGAIKKQPEESWGDRLAAKCVAFIGSWTFLILQSFILTLWVAFNTWGLFFAHWDPYPFVFLNLFLSFQAAYASPLILMSQNQSAKRDRKNAEEAYESIMHIEEKMEELSKKVSQVKERNGGK